MSSSTAESDREGTCPHALQGVKDVSSDVPTYACSPYSRFPETDHSQDEVTNAAK